MRVGFGLCACSILQLWWAPNRLRRSASAVCGLGPATGTARSSAATKKSRGEAGVVPGHAIESCFAIRFSALFRPPAEPLAQGRGWHESSRRSAGCADVRRNWPPESRHGSSLRCSVQPTVRCEESDITIDGPGQRASRSTGAGAGRTPSGVESQRCLRSASMGSAPPCSGCQLG